ncbi:MAG TPA: ABC transporter permease [Gemmatimonadaceae bacterium]|nr:ABC transporter permease [Gemmatimonadaceae bacterium]
MPRNDRLERAARAVHRALLRAYPRDFRDDFARDMDETFADQLRHARSRGDGAVARLAIATLADTLVQGGRARLATLPAAAGMFHLQDARYALRLLRRSPFFALLTLAVLSGGIGVTVFTFSFLHTAMLRPLPLGDGAAIVRVQQVQGGRVTAFDAADLAQLRPGITTLRDVGSWGGREVVMGSADAAAARRVLEVTMVEWTLFDATRTPPALGRPFRPDDEAAGAPPVLILGHRTWELAFGADPGVVGRQVLLDGTPTEVVGVMPPGYGFPVAAEAWVPLGAAVREAIEPGRYAVNVFGRLAEGATREGAARELESLLRGARAARPPVADSSALAPRVLVRTFPMAQMGDEGPYVFGILNLMAVLILLLAGVNVANLLLARANERGRELAVRLALGASRARLAMQALWEPVVLVLAGGVLGTAIAGWGLRAVDRWARANLEGNLAFWWSWRMDGVTILAAGRFVTLTLAALGGVMAVRASGTRFNDVLRDGGARAGGRGAARAARLLVATQVATVTVLMFFGVLSGIAAHRLANIDPGYDTHRLLASSIAPDSARHPSADARRAFWVRLQEGLAARPEVEGVVVRARVGASNAGSGALEFGDGRVPPAPGGAAGPPRAWVQAVAGPLETLGIATLEGRALAPSDRAGQPLVAVVSRAMAARWWPGRSPVGERIRLPGTGEAGHDQWRTIVGVVGDVAYGEEFSRDRNAVAVYIPLAQHDAREATLLFRHRGDLAAARAALHAAVGAIDPLVVPSRVVTYDEVLEKSALIARSVTRLFAACFAFALLLAMSGTYGLMSRAIGMRTREIGVRRALGASDASIRRLLVGHGGRQLGVGAIAALPLMLVVGLAFSRFFPIAPWVALVTGVAVSAAIVAVVLAATWLPTRRALAVTPRDALYVE